MEIKSEIYYELIISLFSLCEYCKKNNVSFNKSDSEVKFFF
jgi:hypothetical protein